MFRAFKSAALSSTIQDSFQRAGLGYLKASKETDILQFDENKVRGSPEFREVSGLDFPLERLSAWRQASPWGFLNPDPVAEETGRANSFFSLQLCYYYAFVGSNSEWRGKYSKPPTSIRGGRDNKQKP
jgi:hypothetical protein